MSGAEIGSLVINSISALASVGAEIFGAVTAGSAAKALERLDRVFEEGKRQVGELRSRLAANDADADKALADKFDPGQP